MLSVSWSLFSSRSSSSSSPSDSLVRSSFLHPLLFTAHHNLLLMLQSDHRHFMHSFLECAVYQIPVREVCERRELQSLKTDDNEEAHTGFREANVTPFETSLSWSLSPRKRQRKLNFLFDYKKGPPLGCKRSRLCCSCCRNHFL